MSKKFSIALIAAIILTGGSQLSIAAPSPIQSSSTKDSGSSSKEASGSDVKGDTVEKKKTADADVPAKTDDVKSDDKSMTGSDKKAGSDSKMGSDTKSAGSSAKDSNSATDTGTIVVAEDFWYPFRYSFADAIHNAHLDYRDGREMAARDEIKKAMSWLMLAKGMAGDKETEASLETAVADLHDMAMFLENGEFVRAALMDKTFARAANALAKHHTFKAKDAVGKEDMRKAAEHLNAAAFNIRQAAKNANYEYGDDVVAVINEYGPGFVEETAVVEKNELTRALEAIEAEITVLEKKVAKGSK